MRAKENKTDELYSYLRQYEYMDALEPKGNNTVDSIDKRRKILKQVFDIMSKMDDTALDDVLNRVKSTAVAAGISTSVGHDTYYFKGKYERPPMEPPEIWPGARNTSESVVLFLSRVYERWIGYGITRADLDKIDHSAWVALRTWERANGPWVSFPTLKEHNDALFVWIANNDPETVKAVLPPAELSRLGRLKATRDKQMRNG